VKKKKRKKIKRLVAFLIAILQVAKLIKDLLD